MKCLRNLCIILCMTVADKFIRLTFVKRTRPELKFSSIDELITQLHKDAEETETILKK